MEGTKVDLQEVAREVYTKLQLTYQMSEYELSGWLRLERAELGITNNNSEEILDAAAPILKEMGVDIITSTQQDKMVFRVSTRPKQLTLYEAWSLAHEAWKRAGPSPFLRSPRIRATVAGRNVDGLCATIDSMVAAGLLGHEAYMEMDRAIRSHPNYKPGEYVWETNAEGQAHRIDFCQQQMELTKDT